VKSLETVLSTDEGGTKGSAAAAANESRREPIKRERRDSSNRKIPETVGKRRESSTSSRRLSASKEVASTSDESEKEKKRVAMSEQRKPPSRREVVVADTVTVKPQSTKALGVKTSKKFERLWGADADADEGESNDDFDEQKPMKKPLTTFLTRQHSDPRMNGKGKNAKGSTSTQSVGGAMSRSNSEDSGKKPKSTPALLDGIKKKSKLDKINELQAKYEKYKNEWVQVTKEKNKTKKELNQKKVEVVSLTKEVDTHMAETGILRKGLSEALQKADKLSEEQRLEREGYASTAKELAQARIDYTKSLNEARELRADLDGADAALEEKDRKISSLTQAVESQIGKIDDLEFKLDRAEDDIKNIEDEMNAMEDELLLYRSAAAKGDDDDDPSKNHLKNVRDDMERNLKEEREQRLEEKQKKLDEKLREFEEERERHLEKENQRVFQEAEGQLKDTIKHKERDEERQKMDDQINQRLKELEDDNSALQARLKSEQLDSSVKLKKKEETVVSLQMDMAKVKKDLADRDSDPESVNTLKEEVANLKEDAESTAMDLEDAQKHNGMLQEEIEDLQSVQTVLRTEMKNLQTEAVDSKRQVAEWKRKSDEWKTKVGEWTEKAFQWKEKAELWENRVKELNPDGAESEGESKKNPAKEITPQELFLQAAMEKKKASSTAPGGWGRIGGLFSKGSEGGMEDDEAQTRIKELEEANAAQHETIKLLRSELVKVQASFKEEAYNATKKLQQLHAENQAVELKNTNLQKELELARKLQGLASQYDT
jgi:chromosome segregation ATPase